MASSNPDKVYARKQMMNMLLVAMRGLNQLQLHQDREASRKSADIRAYKERRRREKKDYRSEQRNEELDKRSAANQKFTQDHYKRQDDLSERRYLLDVQQENRLSRGGQSAPSRISDDDIYKALKLDPQGQVELRAGLQEHGSAEAYLKALEAEDPSKEISDLRTKLQTAIDTDDYRVDTDALTKLLKSMEQGQGRHYSKRAALQRRMERDTVADPVAPQAPQGSAPGGTQSMWGPLEQALQQQGQVPAGGEGGTDASFQNAPNPTQPRAGAGLQPPRDLEAAMAGRVGLEDPQGPQAALSDHHSIAEQYANIMGFYQSHSQMDPVGAAVALEGLRSLMSLPRDYMSEAAAAGVGFAPSGAGPQQQEQQGAQQQAGGMGGMPDPSSEAAGAMAPVMMPELRKLMGR